MWEIIMKMLLCLLIAAIIGGIIGWLLRSLFCRKRCDELELIMRNKDKELAELRVLLSKSKSAAAAENTKDDTEIASLKTLVSSLESDLALRSKVNNEWENKYALLQTDLTDWKDKHTKLEAEFSAQAGVIDNVENDSKAKYAVLELALKSTKADLLVCHERQVSLESELKGWESKSSSSVLPTAAALVSSAVIGGSSDDEIVKLKAQINRLKVKVEETESEKVYLLGRVKKAESGESISRIVPMDQRDDLELVNGIGPVLERMLYDKGIYFFKDIASWNAAKVAEINEQLPGFQGRIEREGWIESAREEHFKKYGERL